MKNTEKLIDAIGAISESYIISANKMRDRTRALRRLAALAACAAVICVSVRLSLFAVHNIRTGVPDDTSHVGFNTMFGTDTICTDSVDSTADTDIAVDTDNRVEPDKPWYEVVDISKLPVYDDAVYTAQDIAAVFSGAVDSYTKYYKTVHAEGETGIYFYEDDGAEYMTVYANTEQKCAPSVGELYGLRNRTLERAMEMMGADGERKYIDGEYDGYSDISVQSGEYNVIYTQDEHYNRVILASHALPEQQILTLDGVVVEADCTKNDGELIASLSEVRKKLAELFGVDYPDAKVVRLYDGYTDGVDELKIYLYDKDAHPLNSQSGTVPLSSHYYLCFRNTTGNQIFREVVVYFYESRMPAMSLVEPVAKVKRITVEEAEEMLSAGCVFGGHACELCRQNQDAVDFSEYDRVGLEYYIHSLYTFSTSVRRTGIPFYAFYKKTGTAQNGHDIYAKTYVPAFKVSGYEEYFEAQKANHRNR